MPSFAVAWFQMRCQEFGKFTLAQAFQNIAYIFQNIFRTK